MLSISGILFTTISYRAKNESSEEKGLRAYYIAEAGIQYGIAEGIKAVTDGTLVEGGELTPDPIENPFGQGGTLDVTVSWAEGASSFIVTSAGDYVNAHRVKTAEYTFELEEGEEPGGGEPGGGTGGGSEDCDADVVLPPSNPWISNQYYPKGSNVSYQGQVFYARENNQYQTPGIPGNYWQLITKKWTDYNWYSKGDIVCYSGKKYYARENMMTPGPNNINRPGEVREGNFWQVLSNEWTIFNSYIKDSIVSYQGKMFLARENMQTPTSTTNTPGVLKSGNTWQELTHQWTEFNSYSQNDIVYYNNKIYIARENMMTPVDQTNVPGGINYWKELSKDWISANYYKSGDVVRYNQQWFRADWDAHPGTTPDPNNIYGTWKVIPPPSEPVLNGVLVYPKTASIQVGETQVFTAIAIYSDGTTKDVTTQASWSNSNTSVFAGFNQTTSNIATMAGSTATAHNTGIITGKTPIPISTNISVPVSTTIPVYVTYQGKSNTGYLTVATPGAVPTEPEPEPNPGISSGNMIWEKEIVE